ncbi:MAG: methylated-DNA--[protein]-cysteine S-methyltransferase [candidate division KSB1 bacterium]|nr:methylated-DNA--[protein]-cysteine S-methyltransferase [candidate division KSB1 bacterium]MDQ7065913.1 methylated-DNA--[protein]-cysteine S-methyltransferase [candidate division KSB1 bacterium]
MLTFDLPQSSRDYAIIERALAFWLDHLHYQPPAQALAKAAGVNEAQFEQVVRRWAGIDTEAFLQRLSREHIRRLLQRSAEQTHSFHADENKPWRPIAIRWEIRTPGSSSPRGAGLQITYGFHPTPFGMALLARTDRGVCWLSFERGGKEDLLSAMHAYWQGARFEEDPAATADLIERIFDGSSEHEPTPLHLCGSEFQMRVWNRLVAIPAGEITTYSVLANGSGRHRAIRAVGTAVGQNPVSYLVPCHRVWRKDGEVGGYRWGIVRKYAMLILETANAGSRAG